MWIGPVGDSWRVFGVRHDRMIETVIINIYFLATEW